VLGEVQTPHALEVSVTHLWVLMYHGSGVDPQKAFEMRREAVIESARTIRLPGMDPALHDHASAELEEAVRNLFAMQEEALAELRKKRGGA